MYVESVVHPAGRACRNNVSAHLARPFARQSGAAFISRPIVHSGDRILAHFGKEDQKRETNHVGSGGRSSVPRGYTGRVQARLDPQRPPPEFLDLRQCRIPARSTVSFHGGVHHVFSLRHCATWDRYTSRGPSRSRLPLRMPPMN